MLTTFVTLLIAGFLYDSCAAKCRKKRLTSKCSGFQQTTSQAYLLFIKRSSEANIQSCDNLWNTFCYINNECIEEIFLLPSPFSTFPSRYLFKGTFVERGLGRVRTRIPINKELKQLQRRRGQPERQKRNGFMCEKATTLHVHHTFWHFFHFLTRRFTEDVNARRRIFFFLLLYFWR